MYNKNVLWHGPCVTTPQLNRELVLIEDARTRSIACEETE